MGQLKDHRTRSLTTQLCDIYGKSNLKGKYGHEELQ